MKKDYQFISRFISKSNKDFLFMGLAILCFYILLTLFDWLVNPVFFSEFSNIIIWYHFAFACLAVSAVFCLYKAKVFLKSITDQDRSPKLSKEDMEVWNKKLKIGKWDIIVRRLTAVGTAFFLIFSMIAYIDISNGNEKDIEFTYYILCLLLSNLFIVINIIFDYIQTISLLIGNTNFEFRLKYSNKSGGSNVFTSFFNSIIIVSIMWFSYSYLMYITGPSITEEKYLYMPIYIMTTTVAVWILYLAIFPYNRINRQFNIKKKEQLKEITRSNKSESLFLFYTIMDKKMISISEKIILPIKILIVPTIVSYARNIILNNEDISNILSYIRLVLG